MQVEYRVARECALEFGPGTEGGFVCSPPHWGILICILVLSGLCHGCLA